MCAKQDILDFIAKRNPDKKDVLEFDLNLLQTGILDSIALMDLVFWAEEHFKVTFDIEDMVPENFATINDMSAFITQSMAKS